MRNLIFCENRNHFYKDENDVMTFWTKTNLLAEGFTKEKAALKITELKKRITDNKNLRVVDSDFRPFE